MITDPALLLLALIVFSDGRYIGAILDRNGLRPARYYSTTDGMIYMSSEVGVVDLPDVVGVKAKCRLKPGRLLIVDTQAGELLNDEQLKQDIASRYPIFEWIREGVSDASCLWFISIQHKAKKIDFERLVKVGPI